MSYFDILRDPIGNGLKVNSGTAGKLGAFRTMIEEFQAANESKNAFGIAEMIIRQSGIMADLFADKSVESLSRQENIQELLNGIREFVVGRQEEGNPEINLTHFLADISLATDQDNEDEAEADKITMMTIHASKGLEFRNVFIVGLEEDLFPSAMAKESPGGLEEERRLFYVALTRAEENCILSYASSRYRNGQPQSCTPSRFLKDIDSSFLMIPAGTRLGDRVAEKATDFASRNRFERPQSRVSSEPARARTASGIEERRAASPQNTVRSTSPRLSRIESTASSEASVFGAGHEAKVKVGNLIRHDRFGMGTVTLVEGAGDNTKATVEFENVGKKQLLLKFAKFDILQ